MTPFVDVIVVLYHSASYLEALFNGLARADYERDRWVVHFVDNSPGDGSLDEAKKQLARRAGSLPTVIIHEPGENTGFSRGNNLAWRESISQGHEYVYLLNPDAEFESSTLSAAVAVAEADKNIGSVQSLLVLQQNPEEVNSSGNAIHFLGFGYCGGYHEQRKDVPAEVKMIAYGSGAGILYRNSEAREIGLLDETLFMYHEDLDLGWRMMLAGYHNVMAPQSILRHRYEFSRSIQKWYWMERNRWVVVLKNYAWPTVVLLLPMLCVADVALLAFAVKGGWWREKLRAMAWFFRLQTWIYIWRGRRDVAKIRKVPDSLILRRLTPLIAYQEFEHDLVNKIANPFWKLSFAWLKFIVRW